jgi:primosomal protein N' (replication factor Y)
MRAEVLLPRAGGSAAGAGRLYTYRVPERLASRLVPGQLVAVPFGEQSAAGIVWALDASDDTDSTPDAAGAAGAAAEGTRPIEALLLSEPLLTPAQRALTEWLANYYGAPLGAAARLMLPPGLLAGMRVMVYPTGTPPDGTPPDGALADVAAVRGLLRERGHIERRQIKETLGGRRAAAVLDDLLARGEIRLALELPEAQTRTRRERTVRLAAAPAALDAWRDATRARLDALPVLPTRRRSRLEGPREEQAAERLLRQLAVLDLLARARQDSQDIAEPATTTVWRLEELRRLSRATDAALRELATAGLIAIEEADARHDPMAGRRIARNAPLTLTAPQARALATILAAAPQDATAPPSAPGRVFLLHGITGSGKTEVYLQALAAVIARGLRGLVLVPEIALTPQAMARFAGRFPGRVALLHSGLTPAERRDEWRRIRAGAVDIVLGSRSALFAPIERLGLIVVDEEHETAYKEELRPPTYHARDAAIQLGALTGAPVVLGSATPSIEAYALAQSGAFALVELRARAPASPAVAGEAPSPSAGVPPVTIVDLRAELRAGNTSILSERLQSELQATLDHGEQAILFLNRRGMASSVICRECGYAARCRNCDVSLTLHASERRQLLCHYCGRRQPVPETCPVCWSASIRFFGLGTERVEAAVKRQFPAARVLRWDRDTARSRQVHEELLLAFAERRADVLVGTQMIAKGLDLPGVTLVGVVSADIALFLPDFRATERAFQLLTQVAGRAGRGMAPGRVLLQTLNPEHFCIQSAARHDYAAFFAAEVSARQRYGYPPFRRFVKLTFAHRARYTAQIEATVLGERLERLVAELRLPDTDLVGPAPAFLERLRAHYRWQLILRSPDPIPVLRALTRDDLPHGWSVDVDPMTNL